MIKGYGEINYAADSVSPQVHASTLSLTASLSSFSPPNWFSPVAVYRPSAPIAVFLLGLLLSLLFLFLFFFLSFFLPINYTCARSSPCENDVDYLEESLDSDIFSSG
jgi:hypothetical protein